MKTKEQLVQGRFLFRSPGIGWFSVRIQSSFIADADGTSVESGGMCTLLIEGASGMNRSVAGDVEMITDGSEAPCPMTGNDGFQRERPVATRGAAMDDNQVNPPVVLKLAAV